MSSFPTPVLTRIRAESPRLTRKGKVLADYVLEHPGKVVFMTTRQLGQACQVSESSVVRFVKQVGFDGYGAFLHALRDNVEFDLGLPQRVQRSGGGNEGFGGVRRTVLAEIDNLRELLDEVDPDAVAEVVELLAAERPVSLVGSRLSYTFAYYLGWCLTKIRPRVQILRGSDSTAVDHLTIADPETVVVILATSRYPNELIRIARLVRRLGLTLVVIADGPVCPILQFGDVCLIAPHRDILALGAPTSLGCLLNCVLQELVGRNRERAIRHREKLELSYLEQDLLFNFVDRPAADASSR